MSNKVLFVDDDMNILQGIKRQFHGKFALDIAESGKTALEKMGKDGPYDLVVSDYMMPEMNGAAFLEIARKMYPDTVRIMLSGQAEMQGLIDVINNGNIFRFLSKPCSPDLLAKNIEDGLEQFRLLKAEKELLEKTLSGSVKLLIDILSLSSPTAFEKAQRIRNYVKKYVELVELEDPWQYEVSSLLCKIGCLNIPDRILKGVFNGALLTPDEFLLYKRYPQAGADMIANIPRLEKLAPIIAYQEKNFNGSGIPDDDVAGQGIPYGARLLKVANDYDVLIHLGREPKSAISVLESRLLQGWYDPEIVNNFSKMITAARKYKKKLVTLEQLDDTMILSDDIFSSETNFIVGKKGQSVSQPLKITLIGLKRGGYIPDTVSVIIPID